MLITCISISTNVWFLATTVQHQKRLQAFKNNNNNTNEKGFDRYAHEWCVMLGWVPCSGRRGSRAICIQFKVTSSETSKCSSRDPFCDCISTEREKQREGYMSTWRPFVLGYYRLLRRARTLRVLETRSSGPPVCCTGYSKPTMTKTTIAYVLHMLCGCVQMCPHREWLWLQDCIWLHNLLFVTAAAAGGNRFVFSCWHLYCGAHHTQHILFANWRGAINA